MAARSGKTKAKQEEDRGGFLGGVPLGAAMDVADGIGSFLFNIFLQRYQVNEKIEKFKEDAHEKVQEIRDEAVKTGYAIKKAFFRTIVEAILLSTGIIALILGLIMVVSDVVPLKYVLVGYGLIITLVILYKLKTEA